MTAPSQTQTTEAVTTGASPAVHYIAITDIKLGDRQRTSVGDISKLSDSIKRYGLLQPLVVDANNTLIAGGRRFTALTALGWKQVPVYRLSDLPPHIRAEMELEENVRREALPWQDHVCAIADIHKLRARDAALSGDDWSMAATGELLDRTAASVSYAVAVAAAIKAKDPDILKCISLRDALSVLAERKRTEAIRELASRVSTSQSSQGPSDKAPAVVVTQADTQTPKASVNLRQLAVNDDGISFLSSLRSCIPVIYTDPPYGLDMKLLNQENSAKIDTATVDAEHNVEDNLRLLRHFIPLAWEALTPTGICVLWYDLDHHNMLQDLANKCGFSVQRWPIIWVKDQLCKNEQAACNFTKNYETAMVLRKPKATLNFAQPTSTFICGNDRNAEGVSHPFWKPVALHAWVMAAIAAPGSLILDPFAGHGSIPIAALRNGYQPVAVEINVDHHAHLITNLRKAYIAIYGEDNVTFI